MAIYIVVNGEFYDFESIRADLETRGHRFHTHSDSEILLHLYEDFGVECLRQLRGEFAFVLWDARQRRLFAARDRFGIKPLFYSQLDGRLLFASEAKALHAAGVPAAWDVQGFMQTFSTTIAAPQAPFPGRLADPARPLFAGARRRLFRSRYWDFDYPLEEACPPVAPMRTTPKSSAPCWTPRCAPACAPTFP